MTWSLTGAGIGAAAGVGLVVVLLRLVELRRPRLDVRVLPYLRDLPQMSVGPGLRPGSADLAYAVVRGLADRLDRLLGGSASVRRRLQRAALPLTVRDFRVEQVLWGLVALAGATAVGLIALLRSPDRTVPVLVLCGLAFVVGAMLRENRLTAQVRDRERRMLAEFPAVAELIALTVAAGEGPVAAFDRVAARSHGEMAVEVRGLLAQVHTGTPVVRALDDLAGRSGLPVVARFAEAVAVAIERGTPLTDVLHAQAADVREASRRALIETGARKEVLMMVPVVFLVLPVTVVFAFWPGLVGLRLVVP